MLLLSAENRGLRIENERYQSMKTSMEHRTKALSDQVHSIQKSVQDKVCTSMGDPARCEALKPSGLVDMIALHKGTGGDQRCTPGIARRVLEPHGGVTASSS